MVKRQTNQAQPKALILVSAILVFVLAVWFVRSKTIGPSEQSLFYAIYHLPIWLRPLMLVITQAGSSWMVVIVACSLLVLKKARQALHVLVVGLSSFLLVELFKSIVGRPRPFEILTDVRSRESFVIGLGFPSGHTAVTTAVALIIMRYLPKKWRWLAPVWIAMVAVSRIYLGVHAPLDIVGGVALGVFVTEGFWILWPKVSHRLHFR